VGKTFLPALSEFYANGHLETPEHSSSSSRTGPQTAEKMRSTYACDAAAQVKSLTSREGPLACQHSKALTLRVTPASTSAMCVSSWEDTHWQHHIW